MMTLYKVTEQDLHQLDNILRQIGIAVQQINDRDYGTAERRASYAKDMLKKCLSRMQDQKMKKVRRVEGEAELTIRDHDGGCIDRRVDGEEVFNADADYSLYTTERGDA